MLDAQAAAAADGLGGEPFARSGRGGEALQSQVGEQPAPSAAASVVPAPW